MEKKILVVSFAVIGAVALALGGCGAQETGGRTGNEWHMDMEALVASDPYDEDSVIENYMSEADGFRAQGSLEEAEVYYQRAYENFNDQQALIEIIHMWQEAKNVSKTDEWINYVKENCSDMNEELLEIIAQAESGQNASWMIFNVKYQEVVNGTEKEEKNCFVEYDEYGRIIRSDINFQEATLKPIGGHFNPTSYWIYEYQDEYKVKVCELPRYVLNMTKEEIELIQANAQKIVDYTKNNMQEEEKRYKDVYSADFYYDVNRRKALILKDFLEQYDSYYNEGVVTEELWGLCENFRQSLPQEENFGSSLDYFVSYSIYTYDNEGRVITIKKYFCDEVDYTMEYSYKTTHTIALGEGGLNTDKSAEIYDSRDGRTSSGTLSYTGKKIGVFGIIDERKALADDIENIFDDYGNLLRQTKITYARNTIHNKMSFQYVYCTPEEYLAAKETGDFSAYPMSGLY